MSHNYWACALEPESRQQLSPRTLELLLHHKRRHHDAEPMHHNAEPMHHDAEPMHCDAEPMHHSWSRPHLPKLQKSPRDKEDPTEPKINKIIKRNPKPIKALTLNLGGQWHTHEPNVSGDGETCKHHLWGCSAHQLADCSHTPRGWFKESLSHSWKVTVSRLMTRVHQVA